jgi:vancomycin resistance protein YoaR
VVARGPVRALLVVAGVVGGALLLLVIGLIAGEQLGSGSKIVRNVEIAGIRVGDTSSAQANRRIAAVAARVARGPIRVEVAGQQLAIDPSAIGLTVDTRATVAAARRVGHHGAVVARWNDVLARRFRPERLPLVVHYDPLRLAGVLDGWSVQASGGLDPGSLTFRGTDAVIAAPRSGHALRRDAARDRLLAELRAGRTGIVQLPVGTVPPPADLAAYERAARQARQVLAAPVTISVDGRPFAVQPAQLATALSTHVAGHDVVLDVDGPKLRAAMGPDLAALEQPPVDATFSVHGTSVSVVPSQPGRQLDTATVGAAILRGERSMNATLQDAQPVHDTAWAQRLNITNQVSSFTTHHPSGEPRVKNIHRAADILDNTIVEPGQVFSLNDTIGPRTPQRGFVKAPIVLSDGFGEDYGGGVSQLATTVYNAVFFGGYKDVTHAAHLVYISRYPLGREATVNYGLIDLKFQNDTKSGILIRTAYSSTSITVTFYGNNDGRTVRAEGPQILKTVPPTTQYVDDPSLAPGETKPISSGETGYDVIVYRVISQPGHPDRREQYFTHYEMFPDKIARGAAAGTPTPPTTAAPAAPND